MAKVTECHSQYYIDYIGADWRERTDKLSACLEEVMCELSMERAICQGTVGGF